MGKKPVLGWIGTFWFGVALAGGGCETTSNNPKRNFTPTPPVTRNATGQTGTTGTVSVPTPPGNGVATRAPAVTDFAQPAKSSGVQQVGVKGDLKGDPTVPPSLPAKPASDLRIEAPAVRETTSNRLTTPDVPVEFVRPAPPAPPPPPPPVERTSSRPVADLASPVSSSISRMDGLTVTTPRQDVGSRPVPPPPPPTVLGPSITAPTTSKPETTSLTAPPPSKPVTTSLSSPPAPPLLPPSLSQPPLPTSPGEVRGQPLPPVSSSPDLGR